MRQDYLDQIVADAVLARIPGSVLRAPRALWEDEDGSERRALRLEIKSHHVWLNAVCKGAEQRGQLTLLAVQERIVVPKIEAAQARIDVLEAQRHRVNELMLQRSRSLHDTWKSLVMAQRRQIIQSLVVPRINPIPIAERGQRGLNPRRVDLVWR